MCFQRQLTDGHPREGRQRQDDRVFPTLLVAEPLMSPR